METWRISIFLLAIIAIVASACSSNYVGGDFGKQWLEQHGARPLDASKNSLWDWGGVPQGYKIIGDKLYPSGYIDQWYFPAFVANSTPILINITSANSGNNSLSADLIQEEPWILAQIAGRPVRVFSSPKRTLT